MISQKLEKTKIIPLRWIGNFCGKISSNSLVKAFNLQDDENFGTRFKFHTKVWHYVNKPYERWGTYYMVDLLSFKVDMSGPEWDDYDENGIAYWEKWEDEGGPVNDTEERLKYMEDNGI
jgi:hypothetical protein